MKVSANYLARQFTKDITEAILDQIRALVETGDFTMGAPMREFEQRFSKMVWGREIFAVNSGTDALILALKTANIGPGDEVVVQANTFYADVGAIVAVGATPRFADVDASHQLDPDKIAGAAKMYRPVTLPVWWYGTPPDFARIRLQTSLMIEDAAQAVGASLYDYPAGTFGDVAAFSFHPMKPLHCFGDGGAVAVPKARPEKIAWLRAYRDHGKKNRDEISMWGVNARLQTIQAVVLNQMLPGVAPAVRKRQEIAAYLDKGLGAIAGITIPMRRGLSAFRSYVVEAEERDRLKAALLTEGIDVAIHYPLCLHEQEPGRAMGYGPGDFPVAERQARRQLTIPCHEYMTADEMDHIIESVQRFYAV